MLTHAVLNGLEYRYTLGTDTSIPNTLLSFHQSLGGKVFAREHKATTMVSIWNWNLISNHTISFLRTSTCSTELRFHKENSQVEFAVYMNSIKVITGTYETLTKIRVLGCTINRLYMYLFLSSEPVYAEDCSICTHLI